MNLKFIFEQLSVNLFKFLVVDVTNGKKVLTILNKRNFFRRKNVKCSSLFLRRYTKNSSFQRLLQNK